MKKSNQILKTIISSLLLFLFVLSFSQIILPTNTSAITGIENKLNWENPNKKGDNPFTLTTDAILNPQTMVKVIGCTGITDKVAGAVSGFLGKLTKDIFTSATLRKQAKAATKETVKAACEIGKGSAVGGTSLVPQTSPGVEPTALQKAIVAIGLCKEVQYTKDEQSAIEKSETNRRLAATELREKCFNGLAYTLAKNQLTSMTKETVNWINSGFNGNPMYVQNITSLTNSIEKNIIDNAIIFGADKAFPYGESFRNTAIQNYRTQGILNSPVDFMDSLTSDLGAFITDTKSYTNTDFAKKTIPARQRAIDSMETYSNDFSTGGWDAWNALTQRDQNNPLGFTMMASQIIADRIDQQVNVTKDEVQQNGGFLNQKICTMWAQYDDNEKPIQKETGNNLFSGFTTSSGIKTSDVKEKIQVTLENKVNKNDKCISWKTVTPGSIIKDQMTNYMNSPTRQLEMVDSMNEGLNGLFTKLIDNFRNEGLFGLSQDGQSSFDPMSNYGVGGYGINDGGNYGYEAAYYDDASGYSKNKPYDVDFDLTRDLGNTYIRKSTRSFGGWDASNGKTMKWNDSTKKWEYDGGELNVNLGIYNEISEGYEPAYYYYTVVYPGNTKLFNDGYNGWAVGDRAFWDGEKWQNWKKDQVSPIEMRGIIQIQSDYIVAAKEMLKVLPSIMPKIGELDYCIPGPNPNWEQNSRENSLLLMEYVGTLGSSYVPGKFFNRDITSIVLAGPGDPPFDNYRNIFNNTVFEKVKSTNIWGSIVNISIAQKNDAKEAALTEAASKLQINIEKSINNFLSIFKTDIFDKVYGVMKSEYIENELTGESRKNSAYVEMLDEGYSITKNMISDSESLNEKTQEYKDSIIEAQSNISKLNIIRSEVTKIIQAAQARRDANLLEILKRESEANKTPLLTKEQYKIKYKDCLAEEDILYYDENDIMKNSDIDKERCTDKLDNDLDGLTDEKDPDCKTPDVNTKPATSGSSGKSLLCILLGRNCPAQ
jgi:hypothetical protein